MSTAAIVAGTAAAGLAGSAISANGAESAASTQAAAATQAANLQAAAGQQALGIEQNQYGQTQQNFAPYLAAGQGGLSALQYGLGTGGSPGSTGITSGSLLTPYQSFTAPTALTEQNDPGYQARLNLGATTLQNSAAARGSVLTGGTAKALDTYAQDYASNEYSNVYNRALQSYGTNATNYYTGQGNDYSRLSALANTGQTAASTLGQIGASTAGSEASTITGAANNQANSLQNAAAATASGTVGAANSYNNGLVGTAGNLTNVALLNSLNPSSTPATTTGTQTTTFPDGTTPYTTASSY